MQIFVNNMAVGQTVTLDVSSDTIEDVKVVIQVKKIIAPTQQRLIFSANSLTIVAPCPTPTSARSRQCT